MTTTIDVKVKNISVSFKGPKDQAQESIVFGLTHICLSLCMIVDLILGVRKPWYEPWASNNTNLIDINITDIIWTESKEYKPILNGIVFFPYQ